MTHRIIRDDRPEPRRIQWVDVRRDQVDAFVFKYLMRGDDLEIVCGLNGIERVIVTRKEPPPK